MVLSFIISWLDLIITFFWKPTQWSNSRWKWQCFNYAFISLRANLSQSVYGLPLECAVFHGEWELDSKSYGVFLNTFIATLYWLYKQYILLILPFSMHPNDAAKEAPASLLFDRPLLLISCNFCDYFKSSTTHSLKWDGSSGVLFSVIKSIFLWQYKF